jgi:aryl-phospho-beta-D-glucosidase BglC (GH1 family)
LDAALPWCEEYGLRVVVDLHAAPTGPPGSGRGLFNDAACQEKFIEVWRSMARRYKDSKAVWAYDLLNEPVEDAVDEAVDDWQALAARAARAVREIDPGHAILVEPAQGGGPDGLRELVPIDVPGVVYSVHMYLPGAFTHQGVFDEGARKWAYPGRIDGVDWDKARLEAALKPVADFQDAYGVHIYIGEFSAIRWAPDGSAFRYLRDLIDLFEARGWDWSYHAFREWSGWSVEHGPDKADTEPAKTPTDRETLLRDWFARNRKPAPSP